MDLLDQPAAQRRVPRGGHRDQWARRRSVRDDRGGVGAGGGRGAARPLGVARRGGMPLSRGIERFTGITQAMLADAPPPAEVLPELARRMEGRVLVAHNASFDTRVLSQAFERAGMEWPAPPVICTVALSRKLAPLVRRRGLASLADALGIEVDAVHRALPDAETCARVLCALFGKLCVHATTVGEAVELVRPARRRRAGKPAPGRDPARGAPRPVRAAQRPRRLRVPRHPRPAAVRGQVGVPAHARARALHRARRAGPSGPRWWTTSPRTPSWARWCWRTG